MKPEEQRIAIAEACGWKFSCEQNEDAGMFAGWYHPSTKGNLPDYLNDLNAMHEVEKILDFTQAVIFRHHLASNSGKRDTTFPTVEAAMCHATAAHRAEAFLRTIGKWRDQ